MNGREFMERARLVHLDLRFVAMTGSDPDSELLRGAYIEAHIGKPIEFDELVNTLAGLLPPA